MLKPRLLPIVCLMLWLIALFLAGMAWVSSQHVKVVVEWTTASELNTAGFNVYRGLSAQKDGSPLNPQLIPPSLDPLSGGSYQYVDNTAQPGVIYYYYVEEVDLDGAPTLYGPIEIRARGGGVLEGWTALSLALVGCLGMGWYLWQQRQKGGAA